jgi:hypothetical protein
VIVWILATPKTYAVTLCPQAALQLVSGPPTLLSIAGGAEGVACISIPFIEVDSYASSKTRVTKTQVYSFF